MQETSFIEFQGRKCRALWRGETIESGDVVRCANGETFVIGNDSVGERITDADLNLAYPEGYYFRPITE